MKNTFSNWKNELVVQIFNSKKHDFLYTVKAGETFLPNVSKAVVSKLIPKAGIYKINCASFINEKGYESLYISKAAPYKPA
jgi:hypothetical protein